ncbi:PREDICTED: uncharacterized protein LOC105363332 [Ceratosolen solmsi marchali]|uniref:Uncharacterized protein LOC105363332 n=1 Tax=Ceratosolen solmsi marchali TaxID=326594 RepID=A0AAJ6YJP3_9HYME|nr:PREDICTED: uncharacterized protein LOC105363332 [Ceratosolen solmsi marchali]
MSDAVHRQLRALSYPKESEMGLFFALAIPLDDPMSTKSISVAFFFEANYELPNAISRDEHGETWRRRRSIDRKTIYTILESKFENLGFPGRQCLLRSICETSRERDRLHGHNGLIGDLMRITFTPSSSAEEGLPLEYADAEGADMDTDCSLIYHSCPFSIYQYITDVLK